ncbi:MAG: hypothetical protein K6F39_05760 [Lachnospiraceae bacterium]|nr:hypothetical protein [Lachnospiraceae bacterium]
MRRLKKFITAAVSAALIASFTLTTSVFAAIPIAETTSDSYSSEAESYYNMLPSGVRESFESQGWTIHIKDLNTVNAEASSLGADVSEGEYVAGYTDTASKTIVLADQYAGYAMNHEMGHFVDMIMNNSTSQTEAFTTIYAAEKNQFDGGSNSYAQSDSYEYFAEAFREYIECAGYLQATAPQTYEYIDAIVSPYGGTTTLGVTTLTRAESGSSSESSDSGQNMMPKEPRIVMIRDVGPMHSGSAVINRKHR